MALAPKPPVPKTSPTLDPYLGYGSQINWGGKTYDLSNKGDFQKFLKTHGRSFAIWARNHPQAANVFDPVSQQMYSSYHPQIQAMQQMKKDLQDMYQRRFTNLGIFTDALNGMLGAVPSMVSKPYTEGANTMQASGTGYGSVLNADAGARAAGANETLNAINAPQGQQVQGGDAGTVLAGLAGWLPSQMMSAEGKAYSDRAAHLPVEAQLTAMQMARDLMDQQTKDTADWSSKMQGLVSGIPGDRAKVQQAYTSQQLAIQKQQLAEVNAREANAYKQWYMAMQAGKQADANHWKAVAAQAEQERLAIEQQNANTSAGRLTLAQKQAAAKAKNPTGGRPREGETPAAVRTKAAGDLNSWINSHKKAGYSYNDAFSYLYAKYVGYLQSGVAFKKEGQYRKMINNLLASQGIKPGVSVKANPYG